MLRKDRLRVSRKAKLRVEAEPAFALQRALKINQAVIKKGAFKLPFLFSEFTAERFTTERHFPPVDPFGHQ